MSAVSAGFTLLEDALATHLGGHEKWEHGAPIRLPPNRDL